MISVAPDPVNEGLLAPEPLGDLVLTGEVGDHAAGGALEPRAWPRAGHRAHTHGAVLTHVANLRDGHTSRTSLVTHDAGDDTDLYPGGAGLPEVRVGGRVFTPVTIPGDFARPRGHGLRPRDPDNLSIRGSHVLDREGRVDSVGALHGSEEIFLTGHTNRKD